MRAVLASLLVALASARSEDAMPAPSLVVLGVAQDGGHPHAGCRRDCCEPAWADPAAGHRVVSLGLVDPATNRRFLFDASPDLPRQLHALDALAPRPDGPAVDGIFLTHAHIGHYTGLVHLGREVMGARGVPVWAMPRMSAFLAENGPWGQLLTLGNVAVQALAADRPVDLGGGLRVTPIAVPHRAEYAETVGFLIEGPAASALYLPDIDKWERWERRIEDLIAAVDVAFLDATFYDGAELPGRRMEEVPHPFVVETMARLQGLPAEQRARVRLIHLNHTNPLLDPGSAATKAVLAAGFGIAREGERVGL